jgi:hypothetical protein
MLIQPDANAVEYDPKRLSHNEPEADGGATMSAVDQSWFLGMELAWMVPSSATPLSR